MDAVYGDLWSAANVERWAAAQEELRPRPPDHLLELVTGLGLGPASAILDVGCGRGDYACKLAARFRSQVVATDPVQSCVDTTRALVREEGLEGLVRVGGGSIENLAFPAASFDLVWCRGVIVHLPELLPALRECRRVLVPGGFMMLQTGYATDLLEPGEGATLRRRLGFVEASMRRATVEEALRTVGLVVLRSEEYGSEFAEFYESSDGRCAQHLMGIARLQRAEEAVVDHFGRATYETALGMFHWQVYQLLGKVSYHAYLLGNPR